MSGSGTSPRTGVLTAIYKRHGASRSGHGRPVRLWVELVRREPRHDDRCEERRPAHHHHCAVNDSDAARRQRRQAQAQPALTHPQRGRSRRA